MAACVGGAGLVEGFDTDRWAALRRPFERLEARVVRLGLQRDEPDAQPVIDALRYALSFAKLTVIRNTDGADVDVSGPLALHAKWVRETLEARIVGADNVWQASRELPEVLRRTRLARRSLVAHLPLDREALEAEVTTRRLAVVSGGGGGAGYVYPGAYELLERHGLVPDLMVGTSIGSLMSMFRARPAPLRLRAADRRGAAAVVGGRVPGARDRQPLRPARHAAAAPADGARRPVRPRRRRAHAVLRLRDPADHRRDGHHRGRDEARSGLLRAPARRRRAAIGLRRRAARHAQGPADPEGVPRTPRRAALHRARAGPGHRTLRDPSTPRGSRVRSPASSTTT